MPKQHSPAAAEIGRRIRAARIRLNISLEDLGELSQISWSSIGRIERGVSSPTAESLVRIATALEVDPGTFLSELRAEDYGGRLHRYTARDFLRAREAHAAVNDTAGRIGADDRAPGDTGTGATGDRDISGGDDHFRETRRRNTP